jgi:hypothetical protein
MTKRSYTISGRSSHHNCIKAHSRTWVPHAKTPSPVAHLHARAKTSPASPTCKCRSSCCPFTAQHPSPGRAHAVLLLLLDVTQLDLRVQRPRNFCGAAPPAVSTGRRQSSCLVPPLHGLAALPRPSSRCAPPSPCHASNEAALPGCIQEREYQDLHITEKECTFYRALEELLEVESVKPHVFYTCEV